MLFQYFCYRLDDVFGLLPNALGEPPLRERHVRGDMLIAIIVEKFREMLVFSGHTEDELVTLMQNEGPDQFVRSLQRELIDKVEPRPCQESIDVIVECTQITADWVGDKVRGNGSNNRYTTKKSLRSSLELQKVAFIFC